MRYTFSGKIVPTVTGNRLDSNGNGMYFDYSDANGNGSFEVSNNEIINSSNDGISINSYAKPTFSNNDIYGNGGYAIRNNTSYAINAKNNWWGETDTATINNGSNPQSLSFIYDGNNSASNGLVNYAGWLPASLFFNYTPVITGAPATQVNVGELYSFTPTVTDANADDIFTFIINAKPEWLNFNTTTGELSGTPAPTDVGVSNAIEITVSDDDVTPASATLPGFTITVKNLDTDNDGIPDTADNCINVANASQLDTDRDGQGNHCDADLNNDGVVNALDLGLFKLAFFTFGNLAADFNGDQIVNSLDLGLFKEMFANPQEEVDSDGDGVPDDSDDYPNDPTASSGNRINIMGVDGPMAGADIEVYDLQSYITDSSIASSLLFVASTSNGNAVADGLLLTPDAGVGPFMVVVTANEATTDLSTGELPVVSEVTTIVTLLSDARVYATPLTTLSVALAIEGQAVADDVLANLSEAQVKAKAFFGFGMNGDIDIFTVPPVLDENTITVEIQAAVAQYRAATQALATVVDALWPLTFAEIITDAVDNAIINNSNLSDIIQVLTLSDLTDRFADANVTTIAELLDVNATGLANYAIDASVDVAPAFVIDSDLDGVIDADDAFPLDVTESVDTDNDGVGDNSDPSPNGGYGCRLFSNGTFVCG